MFSAATTVYVVGVATLAAYTISRFDFKGKSVAYNYFTETARLDIDNTHENTKDGLHLANMGGPWLAIVYEFAGVRLKESGLYLTPSLPETWNSYCFSMYYQGSGLKVSIDTEFIELEVIDGNDISLFVYGERVLVTTEKVKIKKSA